MEKDIRQKKLIDYDDVFVDIHNNITFDGEKVLDEGSLERLPTESFARMADGGLHQGNRDVHKVDKWNNHYRLIYGIENQVKRTIRWLNVPWGMTMLLMRNRSGRL